MNSTLQATIRRNHLHALPCSMLDPNSFNTCANPLDANWTSPLGRWAWDGSLFGATRNGPGISMIDATYAYGFHQLVGKLPANTFGGFPVDYYYSTGYNAGIGNAGLASNAHRDQGILAYEFMIRHSQSGPYSWWESVSAPNPAVTLGRKPPSYRPGLLSARLGHGDGQQRAARLAGRAAI